jgi:hypothetical protein
MKSFILFTLLSFSLNAYCAKWEYIAEGESSKLYIDTESIVKLENGHRQYWYMSSSTESASTNEYLSYQSRNVADCKTKNDRMNYIVGYSGKMGEGRIVKTENSQLNWKAVIPDSIGEKIFKKVCSKFIF